MKKSDKPLAGIRIVEMSTYIAAPAAAKVLGDWGADVIKIEPPGGDPNRWTGLYMGMPIADDENPQFCLDNGNKKSLALNIKTQDGVKIVYDLLATADVFISNIRPEALKKLGLTYEQLSTKFPKLIYGSVLAYGETGPDKDRPGFDLSVYFARGGFMSGLSQKGGPPTNFGPAIGDHQLAMNMVAGIAAALLHRQKTGKGEYVSSSLFQTAIYSGSSMLLSAYYGTEFPISREEPPSPLVNSYQCKDGSWIMLSCLDYDSQSPALFRILGLNDWADNIEYTTVSGEGLGMYKDDITTAVAKAIAEKTRAEWMELLLKADLPAEKIQRSSEVLEDEQAWANQYLRRMKYPSGYEGVMINSPIKFGSVGELEFKHCPKLGEHSRELLKELGYNEGQIESYISDGVIAG